jgi:hypothetical protein
MNHYSMAAAAFAVILIENLLRGVQNKNVAAGYRKAIFFTGATMTLCDGLIMTLVASGGLAMLPYTVAGSALGWTLGPILHDRMTRSYRQDMKTKRKLEKKAKWEAREAELLAKLEAHRSSKVI